MMQVQSKRSLFYKYHWPFFATCSNSCVTLCSTASCRLTTHRTTLFGLFHRQQHTSQIDRTGILHIQELEETA